MADSDDGLAEVAPHGDDNWYCPTLLLLAFPTLISVHRYIKYLGFCNKKNLLQAIPFLPL